MATSALSSPKCQQRSRIAASRFGVEAAPLRFRGSDPRQLSTDGFITLKSIGDIPEDVDGALVLINERQPAGATPLRAEDVCINFLEAANSNFVGDRALYLGDTTLENIAVDASRGVAFMNAHRTGGLSSPSELPFGQTFCGLYEEGFTSDGRAAQRSTVGIFLLKGVKPNGENGPSTDDLNAMLHAGSINDVSVGLGAGKCVCNVCGNELNATNEEGEYVCPHVPGTHYSMTDEEIAFEKQRDPLNIEGIATYTYHDAHMHEVSAVYDGAVPGAGVKRVMQFARRSDVSQHDVRAILKQAYDFYGALLPFDLNDVVELKNDTTGNSIMDPEIEQEEETEVEDKPTEENPEAPDSALVADDEDVEVVEDEVDEESEELASAALDPTPENIARLQSQLAHQNTRLSQSRTEAATQRANSLVAARNQFAQSMKQKIPPTARGHFNVLFAALQNGTATPTHLQAALSAMPKDAKFDPIQTNLSEIDPPKFQKDKTKAARKRALLSTTETGRQVLAEKDKETQK